MSIKKKIIDLTYSLSPEIPSWDGDCCFRLNTVVDYADCTAPNLFRVQRMELRVGSGTHIDAPAHCFADGLNVDELLTDNLVANCVVIKSEAFADEVFVFTLKEIEKFEEEHGAIAAGSFVIFHSGWDRYWSDPGKYRNNLKFPSISPEVAEFLIERGVVGIGIDTLSPDALGEDFPVHRVILGAGKFIVENVANAGQLPAIGAKIYVMPLKVKGGTEAPVRLVAEL